MKTKIGTEVAHITRDSETTFKVKRSKVKVTGGGAYCGASRHNMFMNSDITRWLYSQIVKHHSQITTSLKCTISTTESLLL